MSRSSPASRANSARVLSRKLALQSLYGWQLTRCPWQDLMRDFDQAEEAPRADREFFESLVRGVCEGIEALDAQLAQWCDRTPAELDLVEHAALLIGLHELTSHPEVPFRVVISESVGLARRFGATDGHKFVNAIMDKAARSLRPHEH
jgi:transcription antitermination protein NusB